VVAAAAVHSAFGELRLAAATCLSALEGAVGVAAGSWMVRARVRLRVS